MDEANQDESSSDAAIQSIKQRALEVLVPLVDDLEEAPERKFDLLMTALRASGTSSLLAKALDSAEHISDPTAKAEALIDIINEANFYLTEA